METLYPKKILVLVLLPIFTFLLLWILCNTLLQDHPVFAGRRNAFLLAAIAWGLVLTGITELLSPFLLLTHTGLSLAWGGVAVILAVVLFRHRQHTGIVTEWKAVMLQVQGLSLPVKLMCLFMLIILAVTLVTALFAAPNTWDSMVYHLARVVHWEQNKSVLHYPTNIPSQLVAPPWAEYAILHFQILSRGDYCANLVQWVSMIGSAIGVSLMALRFGMGAMGQALTALFTMTLPMGILQSTSTQNDYAESFWLVCLAYFVLLAAQGHLSRMTTVFIGCSFGLALLTKYTGYMYSVPLGIWFLAATLPRYGWKPVKASVVILLIGLAVNGGFYIRNVQTFGLPLVTMGGNALNDEFSFGSLSANIIKNAAVHMSTPSRILTKTVNTGVQTLEKDVLKVKPQKTKVPFRIRWLDKYQEDYTGNAIHLVFFGLSLLLLAITPALPRRRFLAQYLLVPLGMLVIFSVLLKWLPFHTRLHLPIFLLLAPFVASVLTAVTRIKLVVAVAMILFVMALPVLLLNSNRPLLGSNTILNTPRITQYFALRGQMQYPYRIISKRISANKCHRIGLIYGQNKPPFFEYPLWMMLRDETGGDFYLKHLNVKNASRTLYRNLANPCAIVLVNPPEDATQLLYWDYLPYLQDRQFQSMRLYFLEPSLMPGLIGPDSEKSG